MAPSARLNIVFTSSEVVGFAKTGGLADVLGALPRALAQRGHRCAVIVPLYRSTRSGAIPLVSLNQPFSVPIGTRLVQGGIWRATLPDSEVPVFLIEQKHYFERDDPARGHGLYQFTREDRTQRDYPDNCERFIFFSRAALEILPLLDLWPDILHNNDWQTGLVPVYLQSLYRSRAAQYQHIRTLFTIHNIAYQGIFWHWDMMLTGLDWQLFNPRALEFYGHLNFLKGGIVFSDLLNTVSPTYAREIQTPEYGCGLEGVLHERRDRLYGIVNGVDYRVWNPATDPHLAAPYDCTSVFENKPICKLALQRRLQLTEEPRIPLLGMVSRLADQKGVDLVIETADAILQEDTQLAILGEGDPRYHLALQRLRERHPRRVGLHLGFDEPLAHQIEAGADLFLMPSRYEPAGLNQLYSLKYGTVPVVRATGGLADTITNCTPQTLAAGTATGFSFVPYHPTIFLDCVRRGLSIYRHEPATWRQLIETGMSQDWSWDHSAADYERLYQRLQAPESPA